MYTRRVTPQVRGGGHVIARGSTRSSGGQLVYEELRRRILSLELEPGRRLYESKLSEELQVSRTPLREAIRLLISENLLEQLPTGGAVVPALREQEIEELYDVRRVLEGLAASQAASRRGDRDVAELDELLRRNEALVSFPEDAREAGTAFHDRVLAIAGNEWLRILDGQISSHMRRYRTVTNQSQQRRSAALEEHREILAAITAGEPERARIVAESHVRTAKEVAMRGSQVAGS